MFAQQHHRGTPTPDGAQQQRANDILKQQQQQQQQQQGNNGAGIGNGIPWPQQHQHHQLRDALGGGGSGMSALAQTNGTQNGGAYGSGGGMQGFGSGNKGSTGNNAGNNGFAHQGFFSHNQQQQQSQQPPQQQTHHQQQPPHQRLQQQDWQQSYGGSVGAGQANQNSTPGQPHLLPNNLAAHLNNPGMPGQSSGTPQMSAGNIQSHMQQGGVNAATAALSALQLREQQQQQHSAKLSAALLVPQGSQSMNNPNTSPQPHPGSLQPHHPLPNLSHSNNPSGNPSSSGKLLLLPPGRAPPPGSEESKIYILIAELLDPQTRETALLELSKKREMYEDLALVLWGGFGIMSSLLLEIVYVYPALSPPSLSAHASNRVCNALALLQCVASHAETRSLFLNAHIPLFLYPFLNTTSKTRPFEYLRLTSLGVIGALVKQNDNSDVINFLLSTEIIPLCLRIMETGSELSKTVAIFIVQKILLDDLGLAYICQTYERFYAVGTVLSNMVNALVDTQAVRLLKHVVRCYLRLSDNPRAREALRACLPDALRDGTFSTLLKGDAVTKRCLTQLLQNLSERSE